MAGDRIVVVGSINRDTVLGVERFPMPGETVLGLHRGTFSGGKGANQAVAAARLGRPVSIVARVGADPAGIAALHGLIANDVDTAAVQTDPETPTGAATIVVDPSGENTIVVVPGANGNLDPADVTAAGDLVGDAAVLLCQLEVPLAAVSAAVRATRGIVVLNAAPGGPLPDELLAGVDVLVVNRAELAAMSGGAEADGRDGLSGQVSGLGFAGTVVVTLGAAGAIVVVDGRAVEVPAVPVDVVDTTGAGDAFCGGLADALTAGAPVVEAARWAVRVGAAATTKVGAQEALPTVDEVTRLEGSG